MRYASRHDENHKTLVSAFMSLGCSVVDLSRVGGGCPDLLVSCGGYGSPASVLVEIKTEKGRLNAAQKEFRIASKAGIEVARTADDVARIVSAMRKAA